MKELLATYKKTKEGTQDHLLLSNETGTSVEYHILNWHSFDDGGATLETVQVWNPLTSQAFEISSHNEGDTFTFTAPAEP